MEPEGPDESFRTRLVEGSPDCIKVLDLDGRLLTMNASGMAVLEICDLEPLVGSSWIDFWHGDDREAARAAIEAARSGAIGRFVGLFPTTQTRRPIWFHVLVSAILDHTGKPEKLLASSRDVTEWKQANEERFRDLFDEAPIAYVNEDIDSKFICANRAAMKILGIRPEDVPTTFGKDFVPDTPDAQARQREAFASIGKGIDTSGVVLELRRKDDGQPVWIEWWSRPSPDGSYTRTMFVDITKRVLMEQDRARLEAQNSYLQEEIHSQHNFGEIVGNDPTLLELLRQIEQVSRTESTVLILGETGTGKELIARAVHDRSPRRGRALVKVNCGALSAGLVESELFGHTRGAFTGAISQRDGRFKLANGGTLFLDEVGELPLETQVKLLRVLQEQEFEPLGSNTTIKVDVRVVAATNRDLAELVREGKFRADLFYRLNVVPLRAPALRDRAADIPLLAMFFVQKLAAKIGKQIAQISEATLAKLVSYTWPGNIRELQNVIERAVILSPGDTLVLAEELRVPTAPSFSKPGRDPDPKITHEIGLAPGVTEKLGSLQEVGRRHIEAVLVAANWMIEGERGAAKLLGVSPSTLRSRLQKLGLKRPEKSA
ncbi:MAG: sigma 54-interacting transcriptional regulator [Pseudomonadota bacterium]